MRQIDADALKKSVFKYDMQELYLPAHFLMLIDDAPTVDRSISSKEMSLCENAYRNGYNKAKEEMRNYEHIER